MKKKNRKPNAEYTLPVVKLKSMTKRVLALDPGSKNMGISVVAMNKNRELRVVANSIVTSPIYDLTKFSTQREMFLAEMDRWFDLYKPNAIVAERFQTRGLLGPLVEIVSVMLGLLAGRYNVPIKLITAATWKNDFNRRFPYQLDDLYKKARVTPHQLDSCLIGAFGLELGTQSSIDYDPVKFMHSAESSACLRLINRRNTE